MPVLDGDRIVAALRGAFTRDAASGRYRVDAAKMDAAVDALSAKLLTIQGDGDYAAARQLTDAMGIIGWIVLGLLAGIIAKAIFPGSERLGVILTTLLGIGGALLGGLIAAVLGLGDPIDEFFDISTWIAAIIGALLILWIVAAVSNRGGHRGRLV